MSQIVSEILAANANYVSQFGEKGKLALPPARRFAILTCMDARLDPAKYAGLSEGDAHVIRNAGGRASDDANGRGIGPKRRASRGVSHILENLWARQSYHWLHACTRAARRLAEKVRHWRLLRS
jgi:carbonic anhydrase